MTLPENLIIYLFTYGIEEGKSSILIFWRAVPLNGFITGIDWIVDLCKEVLLHNIICIKNQDNIIMIPGEPFNSFFQGFGFGTVLKYNFHHLDRELP